MFKFLPSKQSCVMRGNCICYIIHNAVKHVCKHLSCDVDALLIKDSNEFSASGVGGKNPEGSLFLCLCLRESVSILPLFLSHW